MKFHTIKIRKTPALVFFQVITSIILTDAIWVTTALFSQFETKISVSEVFTFSEIFFIIFLVLQLFFISYIFLSWIQDYYRLESKVLSHHRGIILKQVDQYLLSEIEIIRVTQGIMGKIFDYGSIHLYFPNETMRLKYFPQPYTVLENIKRIKNNLESS